MPPRKPTEGETPEAQHADTTGFTVQHAIAEVMRRLPAIGKGKTAPAAMGGFAYRGIEDMTAVIQPILAEVGLVIVPRAKMSSILPSPGQKEAFQDVILHVDWLILGPDGSSVEASTVGIGRDHTDKGATKAQTQAFKYLLMDLFCIADPTDDADGADYSAATREPDREPTPEEQLWERIVNAGKTDAALGGTMKELAELSNTKLTLGAIEKDKALATALEELLAADELLRAELATTTKAD